MHKSSPPVKKGDVLHSRYQIVDEIDSGGFAWIMRANDMGLERPVAIKILKLSESQEGSTQVRRFKMEARHTAKLRSPYTVEVYDFFADDEKNLFCMVMEQIKGETLHEFLVQNNRVRPLLWVQLMVQILKSLREAHALGIVHRDLKPPNIMLVQDQHDQELNVKVLDYGIAKVVKEDLPAGPPLTRTGELMMTPQYAAPEQLPNKENLKIGPASDIYALGLVSYVALTGQMHYDSSVSGFEVAVQTMQNPSITLPLDAKIPQGVREIVNKMLRKDLAQRYETCAQVLTDLHQLQPTTSGAMPAVDGTGHVPGDAPSTLILGKDDAAPTAQMLYEQTVGALGRPEDSEPLDDGVASHDPFDVTHLPTNQLEGSDFNYVYEDRKTIPLPSFAKTHRKEKSDRTMLAVEGSPLKSQQDVVQNKSTLRQFAPVEARSSVEPPHPEVMQAVSEPRTPSGMSVDSGRSSHRTMINDEPTLQMPAQEKAGSKAKVMGIIALCIVGGLVAVVIARSEPQPIPKASVARVTPVQPPTVINTKPTSHAQTRILAKNTGLDVLEHAQQFPIVDVVEPLNARAVKPTEAPKSLKRKVVLKTPKNTPALEKKKPVLKPTSSPESPKTVAKPTPKSDPFFVVE